MHWIFSKNKLLITFLRLTTDKKPTNWQEVGCVSIAETSGMGKSVKDEEGGVRWFS